MRNIGLITVAVAAILVGGCKSNSTQASSNGQKGEGESVAANALTGSWKGEVKMPEVKKGDPGADLGQAMVKMFTSGLKLEFPDEGHFKLTLMGMPMEGDVDRQGDSITLKPMKFMGMTPDEAKKMSSNPTAENFSEPIVGSISADGGTIVLKGKKAEEGEMVFVRDTGGSSTTDGKGTDGPSSVSSDEGSLVGKYRADVSTLDESKLTEDQKKDLPMMKAAMASATIELRSNNTFSMTMIFELEGDWKLEGGKVRLDPKSMMGMEAGKDAKNDPILLEPRDGQLWILPQKKDEPVFAFKKE